MTERFKCTSVAELLAAPLEIDDTFERKNAYREGYIQALQDFQNLAQRGFTREQERINMIENHAGRSLKLWTMDAGAHNIYEAPKVFEGLTWWAIRKLVFERDGRVCDFCGAVKDLEIDHIQQVQHGGTGEMDNLRVFCGKCNRSR